ncbi:MAG TPA: hypothetical protein VIM88_04940 [Sulfurovum sp.]|uniref:hypothetical protein n=1 Tax=Sulfurovum sp. TaxID=1969726 RepID=UPI002F94F86F
MKMISITIVIALLLGGIKGYSFWKESLANAALAAVASEKLKHKKEVARLKRNHRKKLAKVKARERAKAKIQRTLSVVPIMGVAAFGLFEKLEYDEWKKENPTGTFKDYTDEITFEMNEVLRTEYQEYYAEYQRFLSAPKQSLESDRSAVISR